MFLSKSASLSLLGALYLLIPTSCARTCYSYAGKEITDQRKCPDSEACCGADDKCLPNRLCQSDGLADNLLVRGTCTSEDWDDGECAQICKFNEEEQNTGIQTGRFPRVEICDEGVYCCRQGSESCCDRENRLVYLDENGIRQSEPPSSTKSASETSTTSRSTDPATTTGQDANPTETEPEGGGNDNDSLGLKVGLGVAIPIAAIGAGLVTWWYLKRRNKNKPRSMGELGNSPPGHNSYHYDSATQQAKYYNQQLPSQDNHVHELQTWSTSPPQELMGSEPPTQMRQRL